MINDQSFLQDKQPDLLNLGQGSVRVFLSGLYSLQVYISMEIFGGI